MAVPATATAVALAAQDHLLALLRDGLTGLVPSARVGVIIPRTAADLPAVVVAMAEARPRAAGIGGVTGLQRGLVNGVPADLGRIESARLAASLSVQVWAANVPAIEDIVRRIATLGLQGQIRQADDAANNRRIVERFLRFVPQRLGPTARPVPGGQGTAAMVMRELAFAGLYERTVVPLAPEAPPIEQIPVTYQVEAGLGVATEQETITRPT